MPTAQVTMREHRRITAGPSPSIAASGQWDTDLAVKVFDTTVISVFVRASVAGKFTVELWQDAARTNAIRFRQTDITDAQFSSAVRVPVHLPEGNLYLRIINNHTAAVTFQEIELLVEVAA